jgi:cytochrome c-type biogenesis protein CcsB
MMESLETEFLTFSLFVYFTAGFLSILYFIKPILLIKKWIRLSTLTGWCTITFMLIMRAFVSHYIPLTNLYEFGIALIWIVTIVSLFFQYQLLQAGIGLIILPPTFILFCVFALFYHSPLHLAPALKSYWLPLHVAAALFAYGGLTIAFFLASAYLWLEKWPDSKFLSSRLPSLPALERLANKAIYIALPFLTLLIVTGAVWAESTWGDYWSWDPKETGSLLTWIIYVIYLHGRLSGRWHGKSSMRWAVTGFFIVLLSLFGITVFIPGLHSYVN